MGGLNMNKKNRKTDTQRKQKEEMNIIESTLQDSSFDIELEYEVPPVEPYEKNRINTEHL
jgi:hypothetical protein